MPTASGTTPTTATTTSQLEQDGCLGAVEANTEAFDLIVDRIEADPEAVLDSGDEINELGFDLGELLGAECGLSRIGEALSQLLVHFANEATTREPMAKAFINGLLENVCPWATDNYELTVQGKAACTGIGANTATATTEAANEYSTEVGETAYLLTVRSVDPILNAMTDSQLLDLGEIACDMVGDLYEATDGDANVAALALAVSAVESDIDPEMLGTILGAAPQSLCRQWSDWSEQIAEAAVNYGS